MQSTMKILAVVWCLLIAGILQASALRCYSCNDCALTGQLGATLLNTAQCEDEHFLDFLGITEPRCAKDVKTGGTVNRYCATAGECATFLDKCRSPNEVSCAICCGTNACNGALNVKAAWTATVLQLVVVILDFFY